MKNKFRFSAGISAIFIAILLTNSVFAQTIDAENTYELSRKARKGEFAGGFLLDDGNTSLVYVTKQTNRKIKYEEYVFDDQYDFVEKKMYEEELERYRKKFKIKIKLPKWQKKYDGQTKFTSYSVAAYKNLTGTLVLYKIEEKYKWSHRYNKFLLQESNKIEKVKMKGSDAKYLAYSWAFDKENQEMVVIASKVPRLAKSKKGADFAGMNLGYKALVFDKDLNLIKESDLKLPQGSVIKMNALIPKKGTKFKGLAQKGSPILPVSTVFYNPFIPYLGFASAVGEALKNKPVYDMELYAFEDEEYIYDLYNSDIMLIFATENATQTAPWKAKELATFKYKPAKYQYVRLTNRGDLIEQGSLDGMTDYTQGTFDNNALLGYQNDAYYLYFREDMSTGNTTPPDTRYIMTKFNSDFNKVAWSILVESKEFVSNMTSPNPLADLKKSAVKNLGIKTAKANNMILSDGPGNHIIYGETDYTALAIVIDDEGEYKGNVQLGAGDIDMLDKGKPTGSFLKTEFVSDNTASRYAVIFEQRMEGGKKPEPTADISPRIATIDEAGKLTKDQYFGRKSKKENYYLDTQLPILPTKDGTIGFFGDDKKGKTIWLCRVKFE